MILMQRLYGTDTGKIRDYTATWFPPNYTGIYTGKIRESFGTGYRLSVTLIRGGLLLFSVFSDYIEQFVLLSLPIRVRGYRIDSPG